MVNFFIKMGDYTCTPGITFICVDKNKKGLTNKDMVSICDLYSKSFDNQFPIKLEISTEGVLIVVDDFQYKSVRFNNNYSNMWLWVSGDTYGKWKAEDTTYIVVANDKDGKISTFLKALYGSPCWTQDELFKLENCMNFIGYKKTGKLPAKSKLCSHGELGTWD